MSYTMGFGIYNTYNQLIHSCDGYRQAFAYLKQLKPNENIDVLYLFDPNPKKIRITKVIYIQRFTESGGGVEKFGTKYYFNLDKLK